MGVAYKNMWSLNIDEAVTAGILRNKTPKNIEIFMPLNAQAQHVDLIAMNMQNRKIATIQVKGSKAYEPKKSEVAKFGAGSAGWFYFKKDVVVKADADFFIFLVHVIEETKGGGRRIILPHTVIIPTEELQALCNKHKKIGGTDKYNFLFWINPDTGKVQDLYCKDFDVSDYLGKKGIELLNQWLK